MPSRIEAILKSDNRKDNPGGKRSRESNERDFSNIGLDHLIRSRFKSWANKSALQELKLERIREMIITQAGTGQREDPLGPLQGYPSLPRDRR